MDIDEPGLPTMADPVTESADGRKPVMIVAVGRQRVGKTTLLNALVEVYRAGGADIEVWNADLHNRTHKLSMFHPDALEPGHEASNEDQKVWLEDRVRDQVRHGRDVVLDVGGGLTALNTLVEEVKLVEMLESRGVKTVLLYVLGNERADLDYLERLSEDDTFLPKATLLVFNSGLLTGGRSAKSAFVAISMHPAVRSAVERGAVIMQMPALTCMPAVTDRGQSFKDFASGKQVEGFPESSFFDHERVNVWLNREMVRFFGQAPADWMPATTTPLVPAA